MMQTNEERRKVAARLRAISDEEWRDVREELKAIDEAIGTAYGMTYALKTSWEHLADLIEPEPERTCSINETDHEYEDSVRCSECRMTFNRPWEPFKYCPNCGAKVVE